MSETRTVFIVGAGASCDFGFPVGKTLQDEIVDFIRPNNSSDDGLHPAIAFTLNDIQQRGMAYPKIIHHCEWIANTIPLYASIDSFLDKQSKDNDATAHLGKLAIASIISSREFSSQLSPKFAKQRDWSSLSKTWLGKLWSLANEGGTAKPTDNPLPNISFVTFNYDRCIEQFIALAIEQTYRISYVEALKIGKSVPCEHVYGTLGELDSSEHNAGFASCNHASQMGPLAARIKTFTEQIDSEVVANIREIINSSNQVVFLGFSFGKINRKFFDSLNVAGEGVGRKIFGTSFKMSSADRTRAVDWADRSFSTGSIKAMLQDTEASPFFDSNYMLFDN